jgi:hypothetical protein
MKAAGKPSQSIQADFFVGVFFDSEDAGDMFLRNELQYVISQKINYS